MDRRLTSPSAPRRRGIRRALFAAIVAAVAIAHLMVTHTIASSLDEAAALDAMPAHIAVTYVRTLELEAPKVAVATLPSVATPTRRPHVARAAGATASAPTEAPAIASSASQPTVAAGEPIAPERADAAASAVDAAASSASDASPMVASADAASAPDAAASAGTFVWPRATKVSYVLNGNYRGPITGRADVEWIRVGARYQVNVDLFAGPEFAPIFSRRMTSEGSVDATGLVPDRYDEDTQFLIRDKRRASVVFAADAVVLANGDRRERMAGVQDTASQFIQFTWLFGSKPDLLRVGASFEFPLALPRSMKRWTYDVADQDTLFTSFGELPVFHLKPRIVERKPGELTVEMWFAPDLRFLPVRIRIEQDAGTYVDLTISKKPEIAES